MGFVKKVLICMAMCVGCVYALDPQLVALVNEYKKMA